MPCAPLTDIAVHDMFVATDRNGMTAVARIPLSTRRLAHASGRRIRMPVSSPDRPRSSGRPGGSIGEKGWSARICPPPTDIKNINSMSYNAILPPCLAAPISPIPQTEALPFLQSRTIATPGTAITGPTVRLECPLPRGNPALSTSVAARLVLWHKSYRFSAAHNLAIRRFLDASVRALPLQGSRYCHTGGRIFPVLGGPRQFRRDVAREPYSQSSDLGSERRHAAFELGAAVSLVLAGRLGRSAPGEGQPRHQL